LWRRAQEKTVNFGVIDEPLSITPPKERNGESTPDFLICFFVALFVGCCFLYFISHCLRPPALRERCRSAAKRFFFFYWFFSFVGPRRTWLV
jgi:hypothetical protein